MSSFIPKNTQRTYLERLADPPSDGPSTLRRSISFSGDQFDDDWDPLLSQPKVVRAPAHLQRETPPNWTKNETAIVYTNDAAKDFVTWWEKTHFHECYPNRRILWSHDKKRAPCWQFYRTIARSKDGKPYVQCTRCRTALLHPTIKNSGTTTLTRHVDSSDCKKISGYRGFGALKKFLQKSKVRYNAYYNDYYKDCINYNLGRTVPREYPPI
jgi:hypothetical protein